MMQKSFYLLEQWMLMIINCKKLSRGYVCAGLLSALQFQHEMSYSTALKWEQLSLASTESNWIVTVWHQSLLFYSALSQGARHP